MSELYDSIVSALIAQSVERLLAEMAPAGAWAEPADVAASVARLVRRGVLLADCAVDGRPGRWLVHAGALR